MTAKEKKGEQQKRILTNGDLERRLRSIESPATLGQVDVEQRDQFHGIVERAVRQAHAEHMAAAGQLQQVQRQLADSRREVAHKEAPGSEGNED